MDRPGPKINCKCSLAVFGHRAIVRYMIMISIQMVSFEV